MRVWHIGLVLGLIACNGGKNDSTGTDADGDGYTADVDCNDSDASIHPEASDECDGLDNNCDGAVDEGGSDWYPDADLDGYGDANASATVSCTQPSGLLSDHSDCNDADENINPLATEVCDGVDQNCNGTVDEGAEGTVSYRDADGDGHGDASQTVNQCPPPTGYVSVGDDCNDTDDTIYPGAPEDCDPIDRDCDGVADDNPVDGTAYYPDVDHDGFGDASENIRYCSRPAGYLDDNTDCDDSDATVNPKGQEICDAANRDEDCDGLVDDGDSSVDKRTYTTYYADADSDGWGDVELTVLACDAPSGYVAQITDCDDNNAAVNPGIAESQNGLDDDCDENVDEDFINAGDVIITELDRQPRFGGTSSVADGVWLELNNTSAQDIDISGWFFLRINSAVGSDSFYVDPADAPVIPAGGSVVLCKTDTYSNANISLSTLNCDYVWGDSSQGTSYSSRYHDNTWNPQRDEDDIQIWFGGDNTNGTLMDNVHYYYDATNGYWPRDAAYSMSLDPTAYDATLNNLSTNWCSIPTDPANLWYSDSSKKIAEYGSPGNPNPSCH